MSDYEDEVRSPTGLERLAGLLAATKENAAAEISKLGSQVQALEIERRTLEAMLESCRDELGDATSLVEQLRLENTRKWRVEERDDWRALLDSMQADRTALQHQNDRLEAELTRCITALLSIFPSCSASPRNGGGAEGPRAGGDTDDIGAGEGANDHDHPPELTERNRSRPGGVSRRAIATIDLEWLSATAAEHKVVYEEPAAGDDSCEGAGGKEAAVGGTNADTGTRRAFTGSGAASPSGGGDPSSECLRLRVELDALKHESQTAKVALESQVFEQEQELKKLRLEVSRSRGKSASHGGGAGGAGGMGGGRSLAGVFRWWRQDVATGRKGSGGGAKGWPVTGAVTVV
eukprot:g12554.t1